MDKGRARKGTPIRYDSIIKARPDTKITLRVELSSVSHDSIPWDGLVIPRTYSVKQSEGRTLQQPVKFRLLVYGASSPAKEPWKDVCDKCRTNEYQRRYKSPPTPEQFARFQVPLVDFDAPDPSIILHEGSADVDFRFRCYPNHQSHRAGRFKYVLPTYLSVCLLSPGLSLSYTEIMSRLCSTRFVVPSNFFLVRPGRWYHCSSPRGCFIQTPQVLKVEVRRCMPLRFYGRTVINPSKVFLSGLRPLSNLLEISPALIQVLITYPIQLCLLRKRMKRHNRQIVNPRSTLLHRPLPGILLQKMSLQRQHENRKESVRAQLQPELHQRIQFPPPTTRLLLYYIL